MNQIDRNQILKMVLILFAIIGIVGIASYFREKSVITLDEYAKQQGQDYHIATIEPETDVKPTNVTDDSAVENTSSPESSEARTGSSEIQTGDSDAQTPSTTVSSLTGALLNSGSDGQAMMAKRSTYMNASGIMEKDFYTEPLSAALQRYITGVSYPASETVSAPEITPEELRYVHILHYDFNGEVAEGELICNQAIAADLLDIFYELYRNEYQIEKVLLIDEYGGDDTVSMEDNNTSCFNYRVVEGSSTLSKHALGLAIDINPYYNPYITYNKQGEMHVSPESAETYADRNASFPYKIDETDLCYKLFIQHGFTWGGNWNSVKDYQHFQKNK